MEANTNNHTLKKLLEERIHLNGPLSFANFMDTVLYHPKEGYYSNLNQSKDFYTNADVHPIFGGILANFFSKEFNRNFQREKNLKIVELGSGTGKLAKAILHWFKKESPELYKRIEYLCIEKSYIRRNHCLQLNQQAYPKLQVSESFNFKEKSFNGILFSNELFDALPFHRVIHLNGQLKEIKIGHNFIECHEPVSKEISDYLSWLKISIPESCIGEVHLESRKWIRKMSQSLNKGIILTIDYGYPSHLIYSDTRPEGTALCHYHHQTNKNFYSHLGQQDITGHVNFTALEQEAARWGLKSDPLKTQSQFLLDQGIDQMVQSVEKSSDAKSQLKNSSAIKSLIHPEGMGGVFKFLLQYK